MTKRRTTSFARVSSPTTDPNHHLWRNGRRWWIAFTFHTPDGRKFRVRESLGTCDSFEARRLRDARLAAFERDPQNKLSLRFAALSSFELPLEDHARGGAV